MFSVRDAKLVVEKLKVSYITESKILCENTVINFKKTLIQSLDFYGHVIL